MILVNLKKKFSPQTIQFYDLDLIRYKGINGKDEKPMSYLEFKLNKEMNYENTFGKDDKIQKEYKQYLESIERRKNGTREIN